MFAVAKKLPRQNAAQFARSLTIRAGIWKSRWCGETAEVERRELKQSAGKAHLSLRQGPLRLRLTALRRNGILSGPDSRGEFCLQASRAIWRQDQGSTNSMSEPAITFCSSCCFSSIHGAVANREMGRRFTEELCPIFIHIG